MTHANMAAITPDYDLLILPHSESVRDIYEQHFEQMFEAGLTYSPDCGFDIYFYETTYVPSGVYGLMVPTGISCEIIYHYTPQSLHYTMATGSRIAKTPIRMALTQGIIERDYRGEIIVPIDNLTDDDFEIESGSSYFRILPPVINGRIYPRIVDELTETDRGSSGFGSTGGNVSSRRFYAQM